MNDEQKKFVHELSGAAEAKKKLESTEKAKGQALEQALKCLSDKDKEDIRKVMNFYAVDAKGDKTYAMDERGQEYALDTEGATRKGQAVDQKTLAAVEQQFKKIIDMVEQLRQTKKDGKPLFDASDIADEIFTPLVREGILPENLVTEQYSEVQKLLGASFSRYKETLEEARKDEETARAKTEADFHGAGSKLDRLKATGAKATELGDRILDSFTPKAIGTKEERSRARDLASASYSTVSSLVSSVSDVRSMASGQAVKDAEDLLAGVEPPSAPSTFFTDWAQKANQLFDKNPTLSAEFKKALEEAIAKFAETLDATADFTAEIQEQQWYQITDAALSSLSELASSGKETIVSAAELQSLKKELAEAKSADVMQKAVAEIVGKIDKLLSTSVEKINAEAGAAVVGAYAQSIESGKVVKAALESEPDAEGVIEALAEGFAEALKLCAPAKDKSFEKVGKAMAAAFKGAAKKEALAQALTKEPAGAFDGLLAPAEQAISKSLGQLKDSKADDPKAADDLKSKLGDPKVRQQLKEKVAEKLNAPLAKKLEESKEELEEYERQLVLMDEGGEDLADQRSIDKLINQLKTDKATLELAVSLGDGLSALGSAPAEIASKATKAVTEKLVGEIAGPFKAAKLIVQLSVNIIKAAERWKLWYKFRANLQLSQKAVSALSSTIQGFYDNKKEQIAFHTIEDALMVVQIAASILGSVPEPITLAVGKTMGSVADAASAANSLIKQAYGEAKLREAWTITKDALDNPKDRSLGLAALRLNPTLSMHAIAWAGLEKRDPIARVFLDTCGLNEQTLADGGTTEKKVRQYLETLLDEDRSLKDTQQIKTNWQPDTLELSPLDWAIVERRAAEEAKPKLRKTDTSAILAAFKKIEANGSLEASQASAGLVKHSPKELDQWSKDVESLTKALTAYRPTTEDGTPHQEMKNVVDQFLELASKHREVLIEARNANGAAAKAANQQQAQVQPASAQAAVLQEA